MEVEFLNLKRAYSELKKEFDDVWLSTNQDSSYLLGNRLESFEQEFASFLGVRYVLGVANGLDALKLSIKALGISNNWNQSDNQLDEIIVPAHTYIASWLAISDVGAKPVPVDVNITDALIDIDKIEKAITKNTKAIMPVHLYGKACNMEAILDIAKKYNLKIIEDAAQAHGATDKVGNKAGTLGDISAFSFYPGKNLGCFGDGGCIATNDKKLYDVIKQVRNYGSLQKYVHDIAGTNSRLDDLQAGILSVKLKRIDEWNQRRIDIANTYHRELSEINELVLPEIFSTKLNNIHQHVYHVFPIYCNRRDDLQKYLSSQGIGTNIHYPIPIYKQKAYSNSEYKGNSFPVTEKICANTLSLPIGPHLQEEELNYCISKIKDFFGYTTKV